MQSAVKVTRHLFPTTLSDGRSYDLVGYLYSTGSVPSRTLQVAVHGASYNHAYWAVPARNGRDYSYAEFMVQKGYAVLALDMLGTGESDKPDGDFLNLAETALSVQQVLLDLRGPKSSLGRAFAHLVLVGHSNGSLISTRTQGVYGVADGLIATGWAHTTQPLPFPPATAQALMADPYVRIGEELRRRLFYHDPQVDPAVIRYDVDSLADQVARGQFGDLFRAAFEDPGQSRSREVKVPVLVQLADYDVLAPASAAAQEPQFFPHAASLAVQTLTDTGHAFNTHLTNRQSWDGISAWLAAHFAP